MSSTSSQGSNKPKESKVVGHGVVKNVNKPGDGSFQAFTVQNGDRVNTVKFAPKDDDPEVGITSGDRYDMLMITQPANNDAQAFIVWWANEPTLQTTLAHKKTKVRGIGTTNQPIQRGDEIDIRTQSAENGGLDVTFDIRRGRKYIATFSFVVDKAESEQHVATPRPPATHPTPHPTTEDPPPAPPTNKPDPEPIIATHPQPPQTSPPEPEPPAEPPPTPPSEPVTVQAEIKIIGASTPSIHYPYIGWSPVRCQIALITDGDVADSVQVTLRNQNPQSGGGQAVFRQNATDAALDELQLTLSPDGSMVEFYIAGKVEIISDGASKRMVGHASTSDKDTVIAIVETNEPSNVISTTPLMVRVRKNANTLTDGERDRFLAALTLLNNPTQLAQRKKTHKIPQDTQAFRAIRDMHIHEAYGEAHGGPGFLPWHRAYLLDLERELQKVDPSVTLPYWKFDEPAPNIFTQAFLGTPNSNGMLQFSPTNPMQFWATDGQTGIQRQPSFNTQTGHASVIGEQGTLNLGGNYELFRQMEGDPHGGAHMSFTIGYIRDIGTAARDPLFFMLHCNVDRLWAKWQWLNQRHNVTSGDTYPQAAPKVGHNLSDTMWPWNQITGGGRPSTAPGDGFANSPIVATPSTQPMVSDMIDYQGVRSIAGCIGLDYDDVPYEHQA